MAMVAEGGWELRVQTIDGEDATETGNEETLHCRHLVIASGHHAKPSFPSFPGQDTFTGKFLLFFLQSAFFYFFSVPLLFDGLIVTFFLFISLSS